MKIEINDLEFDCIIGILDFERVTPQKVNINLSFKYKYIDANSFIDYAQIVNEVQTIMIEQKFELLEEAILYIKKHLKKNYCIKKVKIKISKPNILTNCIVSLQNA